MRIKKLWLATIAALWCSLTVNAQEVFVFEVDDILYTITSSSTVEVFGYRGGDDVVVIPSTIDVTMSAFQEPTIYRVTSIGESAFESCSSLTSITIPSTVVSIGEYAFYDCSSLTSITIPEGVTSIGESAFYGCENLKTVINYSALYITKGGTDNGYVGYYAEHVIDISVDEIIDDYAFTTIDGVHFLSCYVGVDRELRLPDDYRGEKYQIGEFAFYNCNQFTSITIPKGVTGIGESAFEGCGGELTVNCNIPSDAFRRSNFDKVVIGESVTSIGEKSFEGCSNIASIICFATIPPTIEGSDAFPDVDKSIPIYVPNSEYLNADGWKEFTNFRFESPTFCQGRCGSDLTWRLTYDGELIIEGTGEMEDYRLPPSWYINLPPWYGYHVERVTINEGVTSIGDCAFCGVNLSYITLPKSLTYIGFCAFEHCDIKTVINYSALNIQKGSSDHGYVGYNADKVINVDEFIDGYAFRTIDGVHYITGYIGNDIELVLPEDYHDDDYVIAELAFQGTEDIVSVKIPQTVGSIGKSAFADCVNLASVEMARGVMSIEDNAFENCTSLVSVVIPQNMRSIGNRAFYGCSSLASVDFKEDVKSIGSDAFYGTAWYNNQPDGELYIGKVLYKYKGTMPANTSIKVKEGVISISGSAFYNCSGLISIAIPESVTSISDNAFYGCENLKTVINGSSMDIQEGGSAHGYVGYYAEKVINADKIIDGYMFKTIDGVHSLVYYIGNETSLVLPEDYHDDDYVIAESALQGNEDIVSVVIPQTVGSIGKSAFADCVNLASVEMARGVMSIGDNAFENCISLSSVVIPQNMRSIGNSAFAGCSSLASIVLKEGVESIGDKAFENCAALAEVVFPKSLITIGANAFKGCSGITSVMVDKDVENFGEGAFEGCTAVKTLIVRGSVMPTVPSSALTTIVLYSPHPLATTEFTNKVYRDATVYVPTGSLVRYQAAAVWKDFWTIKEFDSTQEMAISLNETALTLTEGESFTLTATLTPEFVSDMTVSWSTSDASVATVDEQGAVTALTAGTATITATAGNMQATCVVTVKSKVVVVSGITLSQSTATLVEGESISLTAMVTPEDADNTSVTWSSSDEDVAMVSNKGKVVAMGLGTATITATANDGSGVSASCEVMVKEKLLGKCTKPSISYENGEVVFTCTTEGAEIRTTVITENDNEFVGTRFEFIPTHTFTAYATKEQYEDSDEVTLTLCWIPCDGNHATTDATSIPAKPVLISTQGGTITVSGLAAGTAVAAYSTAGTSLATATATDGTATLDTNLEAGSIAIVKIGDYSIKVAIR